MKSNPTQVEQYIEELPPDRRIAVSAVRQAILKNLDADYEEGMHYGMIGYYVPHRIYPAGYHCDPRKPLPFAFLGSQKNHMALHLMPVYGGCDGSPQTEYAQWFQKAWRDAGKKLDMGKACIRFKKLEDVPLEVVGEAIRKMPAKKWIKIFTSAIADSKSAAGARKSKKS